MLKFKTNKKYLEPKMIENYLFPTLTYIKKNYIQNNILYYLIILLMKKKFML